MMDALEDVEWCDELFILYLELFLLENSFLCKLSMYGWWTVFNYENRDLS